MTSWPAPVFALHHPGVCLYQATAVPPGPRSGGPVQCSHEDSNTVAASLLQLLLADGDLALGQRAVVVVRLPAAAQRAVVARHARGSHGEAVVVILGGDSSQ